MKLFETSKKESRETRIKRLYFNFFPAYRSTGARVKFISSDYKEIHIRLKLYWRTKNYVGTVFGGSIFGALDPMYMVQLINLLGNEYVVWDKEANVRFIKPVNKTVFARFLITDELLEQIRNEVALNKKMHLRLPASFVDKNGTIYATVDKLLYISGKEYYDRQRKERAEKQ
ncbi:MAG: DUF4442 domain-containing protein [Bacteroidales bacterium]|nr:DUF4442 domain-containing protein [Bacteroidales bacterium]